MCVCVCGGGGGVIAEVRQIVAELHKWGSAVAEMGGGG